MDDGKLKRGKRAPDWLMVFRTIGKKAQREALHLWGTQESRKVLGIGAGGDGTVVLDRKLEDILIAELERVGDVRLLSEESGILEFGEPKVTVIADPLDGSYNAKMGIPMFTISLALVEGDPRMGNITIGYIRNLITGEEFYAQKGKGAFLDGNPLTPSDRTYIHVLGMECHPNTLMALKQSLAVSENDTRLRSLGCISLDLCNVARGIFDTFIDVRGHMSRIIDIAAGYLLILEAGGIVTDEEGMPLDKVVVDMPTRINFIASGNKVLHKKVLKTLKDNKFT